MNEPETVNDSCGRSAPAEGQSRPVHPWERAVPIHSGRGKFV